MTIIVGDDDGGYVSAWLIMLVNLDLLVVVWIWFMVMGKVAVDLLVVATMAVYIKNLRKNK